MADRIELSSQVLGHALTVHALRAGKDWSITILGGCAPHVGSVSLAEYGQGKTELRTLLRDTHKDQVVGDRFARRIAGLTGGNVSVTCGIHYDDPGQAGLEAIVAAADELLDRLCARILQPPTTK